MCMLCVVPPNVIPSREKLENSALNNPHGFGFAIVVPADKRIIVEKTMDPDESINRFLELRGKFPEGYAMWHARLATHGSTNISNCHPFSVGGDNQTWLAHNGILSVLEDNTDRSDTRIFAEDVLPAMGGIKALDNDQLSNIIDDFTTGSKVCVLTVDPQAEYQCYIYHKDKGNEDESGVWWSNDSCELDYGSRWKSTKPYSFWDADYYTSRTTPKPTQVEAYNPEIPYECPQCQAILDSEIVESTYSCHFCQYCFDCETAREECMCYNGGFWNQKSKVNSMAIPNVYDYDSGY